MVLFRSAILAWIAIVLAACASAEERGSLNPDLSIPSAFSTSYPAGSQTRKLEDIQATFDARAKDFKTLYNARLRQDRSLEGRMDLAVALQPSGAVQAVALVKSDLEDPDFERAILHEVGLLQFGAAPGEGLYVFRYPLLFLTGP